MKEILETTALPAAPAARLLHVISPLLATLGYELVHLEVQTHREKTLRLFIDQLNNTADHGTVMLEDCIKVTKALDEPLDAMPEVNAVFPTGYELEVSSPGVDRPLRAERDFDRFAGRRIRVHLFRPLAAEEIENPAYLAKNPKQKNFLGILKGMRDGKVQLALVADGSAGVSKSVKSVKKKSKALVEGAEQTGSHEETVFIPHDLISKANLEPVFEFDGPAS